ncbi:CBM_collapsed_G0043160.mRNA.1.CDS.1 [Saccharomyces cerevisiae]|nr:CBM_collapsed_G0043160.mRNA.1.CDS.1 [Saccharomyces cerevisiae]
MDLVVAVYLPTTVMNDILTDYKTFYLTHSNIVTYESSIIDSNTFDPILYPELKLSYSRIRFLVLAPIL